MKLKDNTIKMLDGMSPLELIMVHEFIQSIKARPNGNNVRECRKAYKKVRTALKGCTGRLSDDISAQRDDRV